MTQGKDATTTANGRGYSRNHNREPSRQTQPLIYPSLTAAELDDERYSSDPIIPGILEGRQHAIGGGPQKVLKTLTLACDLGLSVATGGNFLGHFKVPRPVRTAIMSG
jgi:hypothetical protein